MEAGSGRCGRRVALEDAAPLFSDELEQALARIEPTLAAAVAELEIVDVCACSDPDCASFYTVRRTRTGWLWRRGGSTIELNPDVTVDVVDDTIIAVEAYRRPALREALQQLRNPQASQPERGRPGVTRRGARC
ncbi:MAG: hypothetical protein KGL16_02930 [Acidobacteriota bacterium]|nr:hypothetical protein [Acidobacteriota bacterium]